MKGDRCSITIHMVASLDGIIAKFDNSVSWFDTSDEYENGISGQDTEAFLRTIDCYVMGATTYEHAVALSGTYGWPYGNTPVIVLTNRKLTSVGKQVHFHAGALSTIVRERIMPDFRNVWVVGGAMLTREFVRLGLADKVRISFLPVILGEGIRLFEHLGGDQALHLEDVTAYKNGMVELQYAIRQVTLQPG